MLFRRTHSAHPLAGLKHASHPGRCPLCRDQDAELELLSCPECRSTAHRACLHELGNPVCPTLGCGYHYPLPGKARESPRHWALRRRARLRAARRELRVAMFNAWRVQSRSFLVPFFSFSLLAYVLSLGQWINMRPLDAALLIGLIAACTLRVYLYLINVREGETEDVRRRIQRRHRRWQASIEDASNLELGSSTPFLAATPAPASGAPALSEPLPSSAWWPQSLGSDWGHEPPLSSDLS
ncbi:MAG: hypothetical protein R3F62_21920 [Planctomycetota bacterium]